jgi:hypothetical protein
MRPSDAHKMALTYVSDAAASLVAQIYFQDMQVIEVCSSLIWVDPFRYWPLSVFRMNDAVYWCNSFSTDSLT